MREPAVIWAPTRVPAATQTMEIVNMMDLFPTILELAGVPSPPGVVIDGLSIAPLLADPSLPGPTSLVFYWRENTLYAVRYGAWKAHFWTRPGFGTDPPVPHNPPLLFNLNFDPAESLPVNVTTQPAVVSRIMAAAAAHVANITRGVPGYQDLDWSVVPCCDKAFNVTEVCGGLCARACRSRWVAAPEPCADEPRLMRAGWVQAIMFAQEGKLDLAIWDSCVCSPWVDPPVG